MSDVPIYVVPPTIKWAPGATGADGVPATVVIFSSGTSVDPSLVSAIEANAATLGITLSVGAPANPIPDQILTMAEATALFEPLNGPQTNGGIIDGGSASDTNTANVIDGGSA